MMVVKIIIEISHPIKDIGIRNDRVETDKIYELGENMKKMILIK